jgi:CheY-like chemotaxis protein
MLSAVFDLFTQDEKTLARAEGGLGIGLTIVKRLIELHRGTVAVASPGLGRGTCFTVRLPAASVVAGAARPLPRGAHAAAGKRILVVEDNPDVRESLGLLLGMWGHSVDFAESGPDGAQRANDLKPDVALIDIGLPGLSGYEVARHIRSSASDWAKGVRLVALTGYGRDTDREQALAAGFDTHLVKPIDPDVLADVLQRD